MAAPLLGVGLLARGTMRLAPKLVKRLRQEYIDDIGGEDLIKEMTKAAKKNNLPTPKDKIDKAFDYINKADSPAAGRSRMKEMFEEFVDVDDLIGDEVGSLDKAFIRTRTKKSMGSMMYNKGSLIGKQTELDANDDGKISGEDFKMLQKERMGKQEGSLMVPPEMESDMPIDTYPNIPPEEMAAAEASQLPDAEMEDKYMDFVLDESLDDEEQSYLMNALEDDPKLSQIFDKVIMTASEFTGAGEVEGPGTGVSDSIPARLSDGEFVFTKKATDQIGADNLQMMMDDAERAFDGGMMRESKRMGGMMMKEEDPDLIKAMSNEDINRQMLMSNRAPSLLGTN